MSAITIVGGVYHERCIWPDWDQIYGSAGRAAAALSGQVNKITLRAYARADTAERFKAYVAGAYRFDFEPTRADQTISFEYIHSLSVPTIRPAPALIRENEPIVVSDDVVLRFGLMEGSARVAAKRCIYDPQSAFAPRPFSENGSKADRLAIVANRGEVLALGRLPDPLESARALLGQGAEVVVIKSGVAGAYVVDPSGATLVPAYQTERVWTLGSGDVFAAIFAAAWGIRDLRPIEAAKMASRAAAEYANSMALPSPTAANLENKPLQEARCANGQVYLAGPFFTISQRWLVDETRRCLSELGMKVFSPVHDIGHGPAETIAPVDLAAVDQSDAVFAILDGVDTGTVFEVGHARARGKPVYVLAQAVTEEDLKMVEGSGCKIFDDFVTALHHTAWRT
jgi:Nucleoside 2-deoxyribosyltransferase/pfkB family carbohydrate kinase